MWDDIKMWLYLRLLDSELKGYIPREGGFGEACCEINKEKRFRSRFNFILRVQATQYRLLLVFFPFWTHKFFLKKYPEIKNIEPEEKIKAILASAEGLNYIDHPKKETYKSTVTLRYYGDVEKEYRDDSDKIAVSYIHGNRFISWSGLIGFLYKHHWKFIAIFWVLILYMFAKISDIFSWICSNYSNIPICLN